MLSSLRMAFGDFSIVHSKETFDYIDPETGKYSNDIFSVYFVFTIFTLAASLLFMVFMNFIIAVISDSYSNVRAHAEAHDYK